MPDPVEPPAPPDVATREVPDPINPTVASFLTPLGRARTYAVAAVVIPTATLTVELFDVPGWVSKLVTIVTAAATFAGFGLARSNTPVTRRPGA